MVKTKNKDIPQHEPKKLGEFLKEREILKEATKHKALKLDLNELWTLESFINRHSREAAPSEMAVLYSIVEKVRRMSE